MISFICLTLVKEHYFSAFDTSSLAIKGIMIASGNLFRLVYASFGVLASYLTIICIISHRGAPSWMVRFSSLTMGIYVFHQFVLVYLYYHTGLPSIAGSYLLPIWGFVISFVVSSVLSYVIRLNKFGRQLI